jgi:hypothetical protein
LSTVYFIESSQSNLATGAFQVPGQPWGPLIPLSGTPHSAYHSALSMLWPGQDAGGPSGPWGMRANGRNFDRFCNLGTKKYYRTLNRAPYHIDRSPN